MTRKMELRAVDGLSELLTAVVLQTPTSRMVEPQPEQQEQILHLGNAFINKAADDPANDGTTVYAAYQWPDTGPATLAFIWAVNTRHPNEDLTGNPFFFRAYTETEETHQELLSRDEMEQELAAYSLLQFGKPRAV